MTPSRVFRFSVYEVDPSTGEFRKNGVKIRLQDQPLHVLVALLERPGELVTREELKRRLWPDDTFVDFDHSLNAAVNRLREVLGDSVEAPRFVETLPRRGYRFIAPIAKRDPSPVAPPQLADSAPSAPMNPPAAVIQRRSVLWYGGAAAGFAALAIGAVLGWRLLAPTVPEHETALHAVPLTTLAGQEIGPSFSPDGSQVAFCHWSGDLHESFDIYVQVIGSPTALRLTHGPTFDVAPAWSPEGRQIAFIRGVIGGTHAIVVMGALGGAQRTVAEFPEGFPLYLTWSSDSKSLVFARRDVDEKLSLYRIFVDTGKQQRLTVPSSIHELDNSPAISPDGKKLAFIRGSPTKNEVYLLALWGGRPQQLTSDGGSIDSLTWTADSRGILYSRSGADWRLSNFWRISVEGGRPRELPNLGQGGANPSISVQGARLAYDRATYDSNIWRYELPLAGKPPEPQKLISSTLHDLAPRISPDGTRIVFISMRTGNPEVWVCDQHGANMNRLTADLASAARPRWSPDSREIVFEAAREGNVDIFVISANGGPARRLTSDSAEDAQPSWSADGKWIYFSSNRSGKYEVWKVPAGGSEAVQVTKGGGYEPLESLDGRCLYFVKGPGEGSLWRMPLVAGQTEQEEVVQNSPQGGFFGSWIAVEDGIYFVQSLASSSTGYHWVLKRLRFETGEIDEVMDLTALPAYSFDISPDGKWMVYAQFDKVGSDLMLVEGFE